MAGMEKIRDLHDFPYGGPLDKTKPGACCGAGEKKNMPGILPGHPFLLETVEGELLFTVEGQLLEIEP